MKVSYDKKRDIAYIRFSGKKPDGAIEIAEGVVLDTTEKDEIVGMEIFQASQHIPVESLFTLELAGLRRRLSRAQKSATGSHHQKNA